MKKNIIVLLLMCVIGTCIFSQVFAWRNIGLEYLNSNMPAEAISFYRQATFADPVNGIIRAELAYAYQLNGEYDRALEEYSVAIGLSNSPLADIKYNMGMIFSTQKKWNIAAQYFTETIALDETYTEAYLNRAIVEVYMQNYRYAEKDYLAFLEKEPETPKRIEIEEMIEILASLRGFPIENLDKTKYNEKQALEEALNENRDRLHNTPTNKFLGQ